ncbi:erythromycin esterase family protein [Evansella cellulosilytica]|uniref:Erythromycin esterase n=1 Tax=Evansella cellulosilytica (strain ATCC 21833 / DSM 2522 / FERM P-1141 / JCM 9156 / N-4) TaxID=649639 RepID=E6TWD3_EVAC2|nr:erythromycin esterase family protein [Evansella cellulosilytica]ADU31089.1 Erythromycin esterase [Evansella cellulosilytica DSM 2522]
MIKEKELIKNIEKYAEPFSHTEGLQPLIENASHAKFVLLGEASHGTSEFYKIRSDITKQLIQHHQYSFIAVEGDWPSCYEINRYIKGIATEYKNGEDVLKKSFTRWPAWMWANYEMVELIEWLRNYNQTRNEEDKIGFYGVDVYSLWESIEAIVKYLKKTNSPILQKAINALECLDPFEKKPEKYGISSAFYGENCVSEIIELLHNIQNDKQRFKDDSEARLNMTINALVAKNAEHYYYTMMTNDNESWNIRDRHMVEALRHIASFYGTSTKGIVWEHNTHIGDARATDMASEGMVNVGQITREQYSEANIYAIGFGTFEGTVIAGHKWGEKPEVMVVPKGTPCSWEEALHQSSPGNKYIIFNEENRKEFSNIIGHRAIGVVYNPNFEHHGNYVPSRISERYDAFIHVDKTNALKPL